MEQHRIGPGQARFQYLIAVQDEVLRKSGTPTRPRIASGNRGCPERTAHRSAR